MDAGQRKAGADGRGGPGGGAYFAPRRRAEPVDRLHYEAQFAGRVGAERRTRHPSTRQVVLARYELANRVASVAPLKHKVLR
jgi:hypothetical protein